MANYLIQIQIIFSKEIGITYYTQNTTELAYIVSISEWVKIY